ncbi:MAG TPA: cyclopropane-fatty-acyl-phospholipid synthase family protein [Woeseiaceae bacterium]|nr:cyclopropane-fatty-acyl-phospholipid synthase family protein [Woeseiaceae bacterium]
MKADAKQQVLDSGFEGTVARRCLELVGNPRISVKLWNGNEYCFCDGTPVARMEIRDRSALLAMLRSPPMGFGEGYAKGLIEIHGDFYEFVNEASRAFSARTTRGYRLQKVRSQLAALRSNTLSRSRHNVHEHYDLGNEFYKLWLDERMVYTCAYYPHPDATLAEAQLAKLDHVSRKLRLQPGQSVVEAGCGWGALALHMAEHYGVTVTAYNNSHEQVRYAREQAEIRNLADRVTFIEDDYRNIIGRYDVFVSVGMLEHVGLRNYRTLGSVVAQSLKPDGLGLIHSIGRSNPRPPDAWIAKHIFPGGHIPSLGEMTAVFEPFKFSVLDVENLRLHYAKTCRTWLSNFDKVSDRVRQMYSSEFVRTWRLYLAGSSAAFRCGTLQLYQVLFAPNGNNRVPMNRRYQYEAEPASASRPE